MNTLGLHSGNITVTTVTLEQGINVDLYKVSTPDVSIKTDTVNTSNLVVPENANNKVNTVNTQVINQINLG